MFEIQYKDTTMSKLTVAKDRVTVKIRPEDKAIEDRIVTFAKKIAEELGAVENTRRGKFEICDSSLYIKMGIGKHSDIDCIIFREKL